MDVENNSFLFAEFWPIINSVNIFVNLKNRQFIDVGINQKSIVIKCRKDFLEFSLCKGISLIPSSQKGIDILPDNFLVLQAQAENKSVVVNSVLASMINELQNLQLTPLSTKLEEMKVVQLKCKICDNELTKQIELKRACVLPIEDFYSAAENWYCHHHKDNSAIQFNMVPDQREIFYSDFHLWINTENVLCKVENKKVICSRCNLTVGSVLNFVKLWVYDVKVESEDGLTVVKDVHEILGSFINSLEKQNLTGKIHLVLDQEGEKKYLSILVIDCNHTVIVSANKFCTNTDEINSNNDASKLKKVSCYKILYDVKTEEKKSWSQQLTTQIISCSERFFTAVYNSLESSNKFLPESLRIIENKEAENVGFIFRK